MNGFSDYQLADRRLSILIILERANAWRARSALIQQGLERLFAHQVDADRLESDLAWLADQGLADLSHADGVTTATLTQRGLDVVQGRVRVPGVARPQPGALA